MRRILYFVATIIALISLGSCNKNNAFRSIEVDYTSSRSVVESYMMSITNNEFDIAAECCIPPSNKISCGAITDTFKRRKLAKELKQQFSFANIYRLVEVIKVENGFEYTYIVNSRNIYNVKTQYNGYRWVVELIEPKREE